MVTVRLAVLDSRMVFDREVTGWGHASGVQGIGGGGEVAFGNLLLRDVRLQVELHGGRDGRLQQLTRDGRAARLNDRLNDLHRRHHSLGQFGCPPEELTRPITHWAV